MVRKEIVLKHLFFIMSVLCQLTRYRSYSFHNTAKYPRKLHPLNIDISSSDMKLQFLLQYKNRIRGLHSTSDKTSDTGIELLKEYDIENKKNWEYYISSTSSSSKKNPIIKNLLVCGDGDLSFSASIAKTLADLNINLIATVLEEQTIHRDVYQRSIMNEEMILSYTGHEVKFGIDATKLEEYFSAYNDRKFDRVQFNFPHWRGKANHRYNRQLIDAFFHSARKVLSSNGEIHMALCEGQGGSNAINLKQYRDSWTPALFASHHGLQLIDILPFSVCITHFTCLKIV